ncbi:hypothetical protein RB195_011355 [Necator americanus]|uniref:Uncharacterized protein n=1 Tax=Necator americanus TaxID=51031 RepID=A0ABR1D2Y8_NECAM
MALFLSLCVVPKLMLNGACVNVTAAANGSSALQLPLRATGDEYRFESICISCHVDRCSGIGSDTAAGFEQMKIFAIVTFLLLSSLAVSYIPDGDMGIWRRRTNWTPLDPSQPILQPSIGPVATPSIASRHQLDASGPVVSDSLTAAIHRTLLRAQPQDDVVLANIPNDSIK